MCDIQNYSSFIAAILVFQLIPGAGTLVILNATARNGVPQDSALFSERSLVTLFSWLRRQRGLQPS